ncbi:hypothetical protein Tco_1317207 [Tanacetum coccineum]
MTTKAQQIALDNALVAPENQRVIGKCNMRINLGMKPKEPTYQVVLDALAHTTCYHAFLITTKVLIIYMHQFWATVNKHNASYRFKIDNKRFSVNVEVFINFLNICPRISGQEFDEPPSEKEALSFIRELGHFREIKYITDVIVDHLNQPWRTFASIINKCLCRNVSGLDKIRLSRVQILWGMYYKKNLDFVALIWEDLAYQIDNNDSKKQDKMFYRRFTKIIIHHFLKKDKSISMRNRIFMHTAWDDNLLGTMRFLSRHEDTQIYGAILPKAMTNQAMLDSESPSKKKHAKAKKGVPSTKKPTTKPKPTKKKALVKADRGKCLNVLSEVALSETTQLKEATKRSKKDFYISYASGSGNRTDFESGVPDEQQYKISGTDEGTGTKPGVLDVPKYDSESEKESWGDSGEDDDDDSEEERDDDKGNDDDDGDNDDDSDDERTKSDRDENPNLNQSNEEHEEEEEEYVNERVHTPEDYELTDEEKIDDEEKMDEEKDDDVTKELYKDVNVNLGKKDVEMTDAEQGGAEQHNVSQESGFEHVEKDAHVTLTAIQNTQKTEECRVETQAEKQEYIDLVDSSVRTIIREEVKTQLPQILPKAVSDFATLSTYEAAASLLEYELTKILLDKMEESKSHLRVDYKREVYDALVESYNTNKDLFETYGEVFTLKISRDEKDKDQDPSAGSDRGTKRRKSRKEVELPKDPMLKEGKSSSSSKGKSRSHHKSYGKSAHAEEPSHIVDDSGVVIARAEKPPTSFDELMDTPIDFSAFVMNWLNITNLTQERLVGPTFNLLKGTYKSLTELEYHFEECSKATTKRLDWHNLEGKPYPFDLRKPLPLILDHRGRQVIPQDYFNNNDLEYLKGGSLSREYSTSVTKTKAATYEIKWIEDMVPNLWSPVKVVYDKHAYWGTSHWGVKCQRFYGFASNKESTKDVYSRKRIIIVTRLKIMKSDGTLNYVRIALHDIALGIMMEYLPKRK